MAANAVTTAKLDALAVTADKIAANAITAEKISVGTLSAISADLGTVTAGSLGANIIVAASTFTAPLASFTGGLVMLDGTFLLGDGDTLGVSNTAGGPFGILFSLGSSSLSLLGNIAAGGIVFNGQTVSVGAANSAGSGFRTLRVPNA